ncbi:MAG: sialidase family protein [Acidimicrobiales bacterium]
MRASRRRLVLGGAALVMAGTVGVVAASRLAGSPARLVGGDVPVLADASDPLVVTAENSPTVVADPTDAAHLAVAHRVDLPAVSCGVEVSFDGGATWTAAGIPFPPGESVPCFSPDVAFDGAGRLHLAYTTFGPVPSQGTAPDAVWVAVSGDGGRTFGPPTRAWGALAFQVRLASDPSDGRRLYLTWVQASDTTNYGLAPDADNPLVAARSDDDGASWGPPVRVNAAGRPRVVAPSVAASEDGGISVAYLDVGDDRLDYAGDHQGRGGPPYSGRWSLVVSRSADHGATWQEAVVDGDVAPTERFLQLHPPTPALAVRSHRVVVAFTDGRAGDADVWLWRSTDGGRTFATGHRVNDTPAGDGRTQDLPAVAIAPGGRIDVAYYDRRADPDDVLDEVSLQSSADGGATFSARVRVSDRSFDSRIGAGRTLGLPDLGSRIAVLATDRAALVVWADTRAGNEVVAKQLLARAVVVAPRSPPARTPLRAAGLALVVLGGAVAASSLGRRGRSDPPAVVSAAAPAG